MLCLTKKGFIALDHFSFIKVFLGVTKRWNAPDMEASLKTMYFELKNIYGALTRLMRDIKIIFKSWIQALKHTQIQKYWFILKNKKNFGISIRFNWSNKKCRFHQKFDLNFLNAILKFNRCFKISFSAFWRV